MAEEKKGLSVKQGTAIGVVGALAISVFAFMSTPQLPACSDQVTTEMVMEIMDSSADFKNFGLTSKQVTDVTQTDYREKIGARKCKATLELQKGRPALISYGVKWDDPESGQFVVEAQLTGIAQ